jgi:YD repeat-containing protein
VPGCTEAEILLPGSLLETDVTVDYTYDGLYRLVAADYSDGTYFHYSYDPVGNRLAQETQDGTTAYTYDLANRLASVDGVAYLWDDNGNLLFDGETFYQYDYANRLVSVNTQERGVGFVYNGLGDRYQQTVDGITTTYALDLNAGLTQVLSDGDTTYLYGLARLAQDGDGYAEYYLGDALGSVRQLVEGDGVVTYAASYAPYGEVLASAGEGESVYGYTGEAVDVTGLVYLRARYYAPYSAVSLFLEWYGNSCSRSKHGRVRGWFIRPRKHL